MWCWFNRKLKREAELIQAGHLDSKLEELWEDIQRYELNPVLFLCLCINI